MIKYISERLSLIFMFWIKICILDGEIISKIFRYYNFEKKQCENKK